MTFTEQLNKYGVRYTADKSGVTLGCEPEDDSLFDAEGVVVDAEFNAFIDVMDEFTVYVATSPQHRQAGLVCFAEYNDEVAWYDEHTNCCWIKTR